MTLKEIRKELQWFVNQNLPGQTVTYIEIEWDIAEDKFCISVDVDDQLIDVCLEEIDHETGSNLLQQYETLLGLIRP